MFLRLSSTESDNGKADSTSSDSPIGSDEYHDEESEEMSLGLIVLR